MINTTTERRWTSSPLGRLVTRSGFPAAIAFLVFACFLPVLDSDFVNWDDLQNFTSNSAYRGLSPAHLRWMFTTLHMGHYQPLTWLTHAAVYALWGMDPTGYHLVNLFLHVANALFVYVLIQALLSPPQTQVPADDTAVRSAAVVGALFFAIHPLRVEVVAWVTERRELLCGCFLLLTLLAYLRMQRAPAAGAARRNWYAVSIGCYALSLLSKASGMTFPLVLLVLDAYPLGRLTDGDGRLHIAPRVLVEKLPYLALAGGAALIAWIAQNVEALVPLAIHGPLQRTMQAAYGLCFYLVKTLVPWGLSPLYLRPEPLDPTELRFVVSAVAVAAVTVALFAWRRRYPWALAAWACYVVIVSPVLGLAQSGPQLVADRYTYLSCLPWAVLAAAAVFQLWQKGRGYEGIAPAGARTASIVWLKPFGAAAVVAALIGLSVRTRQEVRAWHDSLSLWTHALQVDANNYYAYTNRGEARYAKGDLDGALADLNHALQLNPRHVIAHNDRGMIYKVRGDLEPALRDYNAAIHLNPNYANAHRNRGVLHQARGDLGRALADFNRAIALRPADASVYDDRGVTRQDTGDMAGALADYTRAVQVNPEFATAYYHRGNLRRVSGDLDGALSDYNTTLRLDPEHASAYNNRGRVRQARGDLDAALADYDHAIRLDPRYANAYNNRAVVRRQKGDLDGAIADFTRAVQFAERSDHRASFARNLAAARRQLAERDATR